MYGVAAYATERHVLVYRYISYLEWLTVYIIGLVGYFSKKH